MLNETIRNDDFYDNLVGTMLILFETMSQQRYNALLRRKSSLRIVLCKAKIALTWLFLTYLAYKALDTH